MAKPTRKLIITLETIADVLGVPLKTVQQAEYRGDFELENFYTVILWVSHRLLNNYLIEKQAKDLQSKNQIQKLNKEQNVDCSSIVDEKPISEQPYVVNIEDLLDNLNIKESNEESNDVDF